MSESRKAEKQKNGSQKLYCTTCNKYQQSSCIYAACNENVVSMIPKLVCESVSIRGISRLLKIATSTVIRKIKGIASQLIKPAIPINREAFELDEMRTYEKRKKDQYWMAYALCSETKEVMDFVVGRRSKRTLRMIVNTLLLSGVGTIKTDNLNIYQSLIPKQRHVSAAYNINHIERNNLNLHLKRLSRRTICFSKSVIMLTACIKIYFWHKCVNQ